MPCIDACITNEIITVDPEQTVGETLDLLEIKQIRKVPVVEDGFLIGLLSVKDILHNLLPISAAMDQGVRNLDFIVGSTPGIAKKLAKLQDKKIRDVMHTDFSTVNPETSTWEAVRLMSVHGGPISIVDPDTNKFIGIISGKSMLDTLQRKLRELEEEADKTAM